MELKDILKDLDPTNDDHWTQDGQARTDVVTGMLGEKVTRDMIRAAAPKFCRANTDLSEGEPVAQTSNPWENADNAVQDDKAKDEEKAPKAKKQEKVDPVDDIKPMVDPKVKEEPVVVEVPDTDELNKGIAELEEKLAVERKELDKVQKRIDLLKAEKDKLITKRDHTTPAIQRQKQANSIRAFIDRQIANRQK